MRESFPAILAFRVCRCFSRMWVKLFHLVLHLMAVACIVIGFICAFYYVDNKNGKVHFYTMHSWLGLLTMALFALQVIFFSVSEDLPEDSFLSARYGILHVLGPYVLPECHGVFSGANDSAAHERRLGHIFPSSRHCPHRHQQHVHHPEIYAVRSNFLVIFHLPLF